MCKEVLKPGGVFAFFIDWRQVPAMSIAIQMAGLTWRGTVAWDKRNSRPQKGRFKQQCEFIMWGSNGKLDVKRNVPVLPGLFSYCNVQGKKRLHQTQKPLQLMKDINQFCLPGGLILDPFAGSGSTLDAAVANGYRCVGIEKTEAYYNLASQRLQENILDNYMH
ncbi:site-specific DNA-methyltransferase [Candidatus Babeliales bacterium]|nr:site-specific DNA-methyltransferase [Candidatus Babeliales bacterium]